MTVNPGPDEIKFSAPFDTPTILLLGDDSGKYEGHLSLDAVIHPGARLRERIAHVAIAH